MAEKLFYTEEELPQRSEEWLEVRKGCIGGSDVACVLGLTMKYTKPITLWKRKTNRLRPKISNEAMTRGALMEPEAAEVIKEHLTRVEDIENPEIVPYFAKHPDYDYIGISFDGVDIKNKFITEIKCPMYSWVFKSVLTDGIQEYYYPQVQLQLAVANKIWGIEKAYFCSYFPDGAYLLDTRDYIEHKEHLAVIDIDYNPDYFYEMERVVKKFWSYVCRDEWDAKEYAAILAEFNKNTEGMER